VSTYYQALVVSIQLACCLAGIYQHNILWMGLNYD